MRYARCRRRFDAAAAAIDYFHAMMPFRCHFRHYLIFLAYDADADYTIAILRRGIRFHIITHYR